MCDIELFEELKFLHNQGVRFLDLEFSFGDEKEGIPLSVIIDHWEQRYRGTRKRRFAATVFFAALFMNLDVMKPFCSSQIVDCRRSR